MAVGQKARDKYAELDKAIIKAIEDGCETRTAILDKVQPLLHRVARYRPDLWPASGIQPDGLLSRRMQSLSNDRFIAYSDLFGWRLTKAAPPSQLRELGATTSDSSFVNESAGSSETTPEVGDRGNLEASLTKIFDAAILSTQIDPGSHCSLRRLISRHIEINQGFMSSAAQEQLTTTYVDRFVREILEVVSDHTERQCA